MFFIPGVDGVITFAPCWDCTFLFWALLATATNECKLSVGILVVPSKLAVEATAGLAATDRRPIVTFGWVVTILAWAEPITVGWEAATAEIRAPVVRTVAWGATRRAGDEALTGTVRRAEVTWLYNKNFMSE